jgi:hypothetical protein
VSIAEEAQSKVAGLGDNAVHQKYVELVSVIFLDCIHFLRPRMIVHRNEASRTRPCEGKAEASERQGCRSAQALHVTYVTYSLAYTEAKSQLTKANQTKTKMENLARELQKVKANTSDRFIF